MWYLYSIFNKKKILLINILNRCIATALSFKYKNLAKINLRSQYILKYRYQVMQKKILNSFHIKSKCLLFISN